MRCDPKLLAGLVAGLALAGGIAAAAPPESQPPPKTARPKPPPNLTMIIQQVFCNDLGNGQYNVQVKVRVQNASADSTWKSFTNRVQLGSNGPFFELAPGNPNWVVTAPLYGGSGQVKHLNVKTKAGRYKIIATADFNNDHPETNENDNRAAATVAAAPNC